jgi:hypothetical protein
MLVARGAPKNPSARCADCAQSMPVISRTTSPHQGVRALVNCKGKPEEPRGGWRVPHRNLFLLDLQLP